jgi:hypothetical protein
VTGVKAVVKLKVVNVWGDINTDQTPDWQNIVPGAGSGWTEINPSQTPNWTDVLVPSGFDN